VVEGQPVVRALVVLRAVEGQPVVQALAAIQAMEVLAFVDRSSSSFLPPLNRKT
jgi:hypothetical protein